MRKNPASETGLFLPRIVIALTLLAASGWMAMLSVASTPSAGTLTPATPFLTYTAGPFVAANPTPVLFAHVGPVCNAATCDSYALDVNLPAGYVAANPNASIRVSLSWTDTGSGNSDYDLYVFAGVVGDTDGQRTPEYQGDGQSNPEVASIFPLQDGQSKFTIKVVPFTPTAETVRVRIELLSGAGDPDAFPNFGGPDASEPGKPRFQTYYPPAGSSAEPGSGEFNIGFNKMTGRIMANNAGPVWRLTPAEKLGKPECCEALWEDRSSTIANQGVDPILWTDEVSGRTFASNFTGGANAAYAYTDSDGEPTLTSPTGWTVLGAALPNGGADHQTIATGPYPEGFLLNGVPAADTVNKGQATYYCSQAVVGPAFCQRSDDLGATYGPGFLAYDGAPGCRGLHGHMRVAPDGTVYVPVPNCADATTSQNGVAVSTDGGVTWVEKYIPNSPGASRGSDPGIAIDKNNRVYFFYILEEANGNEGHMYVQTSTDRGTTWSNPRNLGASHGVKNAAFPHGVAGDGGRAAVGFLGTNIPGNLESIAFPGYWYSFVSTTYDGGDTWTTVNVSPNDPVQGKGGIWHGGGSNQNRNLLDFNEITMDDKGRVLYGYSDGCVGSCVGDPDNNSFTAHMRIARQIGGKTLLASQDQFVDTTEAIDPKAPCLSGKRDARASHLNWKVPDDGGSEIVGYQIHRGTTAAGNGVLLGQTQTTKPSFSDTTADPLVEHYFYTVKAVTAAGVSVASNEIQLTLVPPPPCVNPAGPFIDDFEPAANAGWVVDTAKNDLPTSPVWQVRTDPSAHSASNSFSSDASTPELKDDRLIAPPQNISPTSRLVFWHRYFFEEGYDGAALEVSNDFGATWVDVLQGGGSFVSGGYNGTIASGYGNALAGRQAWTGGNPDDEMTKVEVDLGAFAGFNVMVRFRLATDSFAPGATPGTMWFVDDVEFTNLQSCQLSLTKVVSRKGHGSAGVFDIDLAAGGGTVIEPRAGSGGSANTHYMVFRFNSPLADVGNVSATSGAQAVQSSGDFNPATPYEYIVTLTGAPNARTVTVNLSDIVDVSGNNAGALSASMGLLLGDVNSTRLVDGNDVSAVQSKTRQPGDSTNFRMDVNATGLIDGNDVSAVQGKTRTRLQ